MTEDEVQIREQAYELFLEDCDKFEAYDQISYTINFHREYLDRVPRETIKQIINDVYKND